MAIFESIDGRKYRRTSQIAEFQDEEKMGRFCGLPKEGTGILLMMTTEFAPESHVKVVLENLTFALMQSARRELGWCQLS